jgi:hypothetical protein
VIGAAVEKLEMSSVVSLAVGTVAEMALDRLQEYVGQDPQANSKAAAGAAANEGASALIQTTEEVVKRRMTGLTTRLVKTRVEAGQLAGRMAMEREKVAQDALAKNRSYEHPSTATLMNQFRDALDRYSDTCRAIAAIATQIQPSLVASFNELRMNYLRARANKSSDLTYRVDYAAAWDLGGEDSHGRESLRVFEPKIAGFDRLSEPMRNFITHRKLSDYATDADVSVRVNCKQGGHVIIEKKVGREPTFYDVDGIAAVRATMRGAQGFWRLLEEQIG